jgi:DNA processing protein
MPSQDSPPPSETLTAWLVLAHTAGLGPVGACALLERFGTPRAVLASAPGPVAEVLGSREVAAALLGTDTRRDEAVAAALAWLDVPGRLDGRGEPGRFILPLADPRYPPRLRDLPDPPTVLYGLGDPAWLSWPQVAIVGSRNATAIGARTAHGLARDLADAGWSVTSGLAEGIDRAAHEGALAGAPGGTVAVVGTGIDLTYPSRHRDLARRIAGRGAVVSELPVGAPPLARHFPRRNRLIAALVHAVLVVEAAPRSGSLITARLAADLGREVLAVPGSIHSPLARGCNDLIRQGAKLVAVARDILEELPPSGPLGLRWPQPAGATAAGAAPPREDTGPAAVPPSGLSAAHAAVLCAMSADPVSVEALAAAGDLPVAGALAALQTLELSGMVERLPDGSYIRCS